jgi:glycosyltransferase involved in cell wall biosynthesis
LITRLIRGGADENTIISCNAQAAAGHEVTLVYGVEYHADMLTKLHPRVATLQLPTLVRPLSPRKDNAAVRDFRKICNVLSPDIVHTHTSKAGVIGRIAAWGARVPVVIHGVHILPFLNVSVLQRALYLLVERSLDRITDFYVNVSEGMMEEGIRHGVGAAEKHTVIRSGMSVEDFQYASAIGDDEYSELRPAYAKKWSDVDVILMVAAFEERKRHLEFLNAFAQVVSSNPSAILLLAGAGPLEDEIMSKVSELGLTDRVRIIGFRTDIARWMKLATVCVLSSEREGLPRVLVQYALAQVPIVATELPGAEVIVKNGLTGYLVPKVSDMAAPIAKVIDDEQIRKRLKDNLSNLDLSAWSSASMVSQLQALYDRLLAQKKTA